MFAEGRTELAEEYLKRSNDILSGEYARNARDEWERGYYSTFVYEGWVYDGRNYNLFAILADVRNGRGFAGVRTGEGFNPISEPKGLPEDMSEYMQEQAKHMDHTPSWFTLRELEEYNWDQVTTHYGTVDVEEYKIWKEKGKPNGWSGGVSGSSVTHLTNDQMEDLVSGTYAQLPDMSYYTKVSWVESYKESVGSFYTDSIKMLEDVSLGDPDSVRIVFWFDS